MIANHVLNDAEKARGQRSSGLIRTAKSNAFHWEVRDHLIELAKSGELGATLKERARQLNARGVRTTRGNELDERKLGAALKALGADTSRIKGLIVRAEIAAEDFDVDDADMFEQLWHEWLYHHTRAMLENRSVFDVSNEHLFIFKPEHPKIWRDENHPTKRDPRTKVWWYGRTPVLPQQARLVYALFGMFGYRKRNSKTGALMFP
jgi:hypothetical protein